MEISAQTEQKKKKDILTTVIMTGCMVNFYDSKAIKMRLGHTNYVTTVYAAEKYKKTVTDASLMTQIFNVFWQMNVFKRADIKGTIIIALKPFQINNEFRLTAITTC